ncbi:MAG: hypothetical protein M3T56_05930 [Chloroflexota bacterium]|nr:hypothetical protein [Chloroflexota bacterium]
MCKYFDASDDLAVETTRDMDPVHPGKQSRGLMKAHITVYEPDDYAHPSLPTLRAFLAIHTDPATGLVRYDLLGPTLAINPSPLLKLPEEYLEYRVSPGASFVSYEALARTRALAEGESA